MAAELVADMLNTSQQRRNLMPSRSFDAHDAYQELQRYLATERADTPTSRAA